MQTNLVEIPFIYFYKLEIILHMQQKKYNEDFMSLAVKEYHEKIIPKIKTLKKIKDLLCENNKTSIDISEKHNINKYTISRAITNNQKQARNLSILLYNKIYNDLTKKSLLIEDKYNYETIKKKVLNNTKEIEQMIHDITELALTKRIFIPKKILLTEAIKTYVLKYEKDLKGREELSNKKLLFLIAQINKNCKEDN